MPSLDQLQKLLVADPTDPFVPYAMAMEHVRLGQLVTALDYFDRCLALDSAYCYAYFHKAQVQKTLGDCLGARATLTLGVTAAKKASDSKAVSEMQGLLDELE
jgi:tetratricopeptide (TPR) repeat protein